MDHASTLRTSLRVCPYIFKEDRMWYNESHIRGFSICTNYHKLLNYGVTHKMCFNSV